GRQRGDGSPGRPRRAGPDAAPAAHRQPVDHDRAFYLRGRPRGPGRAQLPRAGRLVTPRRTQRTHMRPCGRPVLAGQPQGRFAIFLPREKPPSPCPAGPEYAIIGANTCSGGGTAMSAVTVRGVALGQGRPKIIVPIFAQTAADAAGQAAALGATAADLAELRLDPLRAGDGSLPDAAALCAAVRRVRAALDGRLPLLV